MRVLPDKGKNIFSATEIVKAFSQKGEKIALTPEHARILSNKEIGKREQLLYKQIIWAKQGGWGDFG